MQLCDVLIVGGGPAGSTCAWALGRAGATVIVLDRATFPRDKVCGGWVTPQVLEALDLTPSAYKSTGLVMQELTTFRAGILGRRPVDVSYGEAVSYGIRRCEFDTYLLRRAHARVLEGTPLRSMRRDGSAWIVNDEIRTPLIVGAGGHFCPVAQQVAAKRRQGLVVAREFEFALRPGDDCGVEPGAVELFFSADLDGYGWCLRKDEYVNVGIGRRTASDFQRHVRQFASALVASRRIPARAGDWERWRGHAYLLASAMRPPVAEGMLLIGDAAGLAYSESGEGIGPAVKSARLAADAITHAAGRFSADDLAPYARRIAPAMADGPFRRIRVRMPAALGRLALSSAGLTRLALDRWFLRRHERIGSPSERHVAA